MSPTVVRLVMALTLEMQKCKTKLRRYELHPEEDVPEPWAKHLPSVYWRARMICTEEVAYMVGSGKYPGLIDIAQRPFMRPKHFVGSIAQYLVSDVQGDRYVLPGHVALVKWGTLLDAQREDGDKTAKLHLVED